MLPDQGAHPGVRARRQLGRTARDRHQVPDALGDERVDHAHQARLHDLLAAQEPDPVAEEGAPRGTHVVDGSRTHVDVPRPRIPDHGGDAGRQPCVHIDRDGVVRRAVDHAMVGGDHEHRSGSQGVQQRGDDGVGPGQRGPPLRALDPELVADTVDLAPVDVGQRPRRAGLHGAKRLDPTGEVGRRDAVVLAAAQDRARQAALSILLRRDRRDRHPGAGSELEHRRFGLDRDGNGIAAPVEGLQDPVDLRQPEGRADQPVVTRQGPGAQRRQSGRSRRREGRRDRATAQRGQGRGRVERPCQETGSEPVDEQHHGMPCRTQAQDVVEPGDTDRGGRRGDDVRE